MNRGFASAVNQGIMAAKYEYVCLLNNDLTLDPDWFSKIIHEIIQNKDPKVTTFCGTVLTQDGKYYESSGLDFNYSGKCSHLNHGKKFSAKNSPSQPYFIWGSPAALVVYRRQTLIKIGLFDENFFAYEEDVDIALRLHKLGYKTLLVPEALSYHLGGGTSSKMGNFRNIHDAKNWIFIILKNYTCDEIKKNLIPIVVQRLRNLSGLIKLTIYHDGWKSIYTVPSALYQAYWPIIEKWNLVIKKRRELLEPQDS